MSEMLGNQYFLSRNFFKAQEAYEKVLEAEPQNDYVKKRLIVCFTQTGKILKAFDLFFDIVKKDIEIITSTDLVADDCPCPELIRKYENVKPNSECSRDAKLMLGMLWLYCNTQTSLEFFDNILSEEKTDSRIVEIRNIIKEKISHTENHYSQNN